MKGPESFIDPEIERELTQHANAAMARMQIINLATLQMAVGRERPLLTREQVTKLYDRFDPCRT